MEFKASVIGRVGQAPDFREVSGGKKVCSYSVAANPTKDKTVWVRVTTWDKRAEIDARYIKKGMLVKCEGTLNTDDDGKPRTYEKDGVVRASNFELTAYDVKYLTWGDKEDEESESESPVSQIPF